MILKEILRFPLRNFLEKLQVLKLSIKWGRQSRLQIRVFFLFIITQKQVHTGLI